jgi:hypothetical protein
VQTLQSLQAWNVSVLAISGLQFDLSTPHGPDIALSSRPISCPAKRSNILAWMVRS